MSTEYDVRANLTLRDSGFARTAQRASGRIRAIADRLRGASRAGNGLFGVLTRIGAGYMGFHAITSAIRGAVGGMFGFQMQVERTQIGLQSILAAVDGISFADAGRSAQAVWSALSQDALRSTATTAEMFDIFQGIVGPIRAAGASLQTVRDITGSTVAAASALGVDFAQAQRDIGLMVRGTAGMDTRMFSLLRSMGLITQETAEWNNNMSTGERITELQRALGSFDAAAAAYGESFAGASSSFKDIVQQLSGAMSRPIFDRLRRYLLDINRWLITNRELVEQNLTRMGEGIARAMDYVVSNARAVMEFITSRWETLARRFETVRDALTANAGPIQQLAVALTALSALRTVLGPILSVIAGAVSVFEAMGLVGGGGGAAAAAAGAEGGTAAAAGGAGAAMGPLVIVLAALAAMAVSLYEYWNLWVQILTPLLPILSGLGQELMIVAGLIWEVLRPILKVFGTYMMIVVVVALYALLAVLRFVVTFIHGLMAVLASVANFFEEWVVDPIIEGILSIGTFIAHFMGEMFGYQMTVPSRGSAGGSRARAATPEGPSADTSLEDLMNATPDTTTPPTVNNFHRGSVQVRQDFREADPDRVLVRMTNDINSAAVSRIGSGFAPALTR